MTVCLSARERRRRGADRALLDAGFPGWRDAETWRRKTIAERSSGALDPAGYSWADRPRIDRGDGLFLVGDSVAAPGMLSEVAHRSALEAAARIAVSPALPRS